MGCPGAEADHPLVRVARLQVWPGDCSETCIGDTRERDPVQENVSHEQSLLPNTVKVSGRKA